MGEPWETSAREPKRMKLLTGEPPILTNDYEVYPCGCVLAVGVRMDTHETALAVSGCQQHREVMNRVIERYRESLNDPLATPAMTVLTAMYAEALGAKPN